MVFKSGYDSDTSTLRHTGTHFSERKRDEVTSLVIALSNLLPRNSRTQYDPLIKTKTIGFLDKKL